MVSSSEIEGALPGRRRQVARSHLAPLTYLLPAATLYMLFNLWPMVRLGVLSLEQWDGFTSPSFAGLANYGAVFSDPGFGDELRHTLVWLAVTLFVPVLIGLLLALLLAMMPRQLRAPVRAALLLPMVFPTVLIAVAWKLFYNPLSGPLTGLLASLHLSGLEQDWLGDPNVALQALLVPACWAAYGLSMLLCEAALAGINPGLLEAAALDGAGRWSRFWWIVLPSLRGALPLATIVTGLCAVPSYDLILFITNGGPGYATTTLTFDAYGRAFSGQGQVGQGAALACLQGLAGLILAGAALAIARGQERAADDSESGAHHQSPGPGATWSAGLLGLLAAALALAPLAWLLVLALQPSAGMDIWQTLRHNLDAVGAEGLGSAMWASLCVAVAVSVATTALATVAAFALAISRSRSLALTAAALLALGLFQPVAVSIIPLFYLLNALGLINTPTGVALPQIAHALPMAILLLWVGMRGLSMAVLEAAQIDGAPPRQVLRFIAVPLLLPLIVVVAVWSFLTSWNDYLLPTVVLQDGSLQTVPLALAHFIGRFDTEYAVLATGALLVVLPVLALYCGLYGVMARGVRGLSSGARLGGVNHDA
jgi:ABC-type sugar transport system permease subunit